MLPWSCVLKNHQPKWISIKIGLFCLNTYILQCFMFVVGLKIASWSVGNGGQYISCITEWSGMNIAGDLKNQILDNHGIFFPHMSNDDIHWQDWFSQAWYTGGWWIFWSCLWWIPGWFLFIDRLDLICQIVALEIFLVFPVPLLALPSMKFVLACRTARPLPPFLLCNGLKPFSANTAGSFSTYIFCHFKISRVKIGQKIHAKWDIGQQRRDIGGIAGYVFFWVGRVLRRGKPVTLFRHWFEGMALHYSNLNNRPDMVWCTDITYIRLAAIALSKIDTPMLR